jgi:hypothetical protein
VLINKELTVMVCPFSAISERKNSITKIVFGERIVPMGIETETKTILKMIRDDLLRNPKSVDMTYTDGVLDYYLRIEEMVLETLTDQTLPGEHYI